MTTVDKIAFQENGALDAASTEVIRRAAEAIRRGELIAFPTETVYGLGANALDAAAVARIFAAKGRPANNPLIVHVPGAAQARELVTDWPAAAERLAERFWPGPLTLVLRRRASVPAIVAAGAETLAVRAPAHPVALALLQAAGVPIAAPSANRSNQVSPTTAQHVLDSLGSAVDLMLDAGPTSVGLESTVLDLTTPRPRLLRPGSVTPSEIESVIGPIDRPANLVADPQEPARSPGAGARHYAPRAPMECHATGAAERVEQLAGQGLRVGLLAYGEHSRQHWQPSLASATRSNIIIAALPADAAAYAAGLYAALHSLDAAGVARIIVDLPPDTEPWLAIRDRLRRGSTQYV